jgi:hypothetical protein
MWNSRSSVGLPGLEQDPLSGPLQGPMPFQPDRSRFYPTVEGFEPNPQTISRTTMGTPGTRSTGAPGVSQQAWPRPTPDIISRLARNPRMQEDFDLTFGPGSAAHYLSMLQQGQR